jgi:Tfp pilus assembly PilM family ATPase
MRWLIKQGPPVGCAFGRDCFRLAGRPAEGGELHLHEGRLTLDSTTHVIDIESSSAAVKQAVLAAGLSPGRAFIPAPRRDAILSIPNHLLIFRTIRLAPMPEVELLSATHWKIADEAGLDPQESTSQIVIASPVVESGKQKTEVLAVATKNQDLQPYIDIAENAGLAVSAIDLASSAICRSLCRTSAAPTNGAPGHEDRLLLVLEEDFAALTIASGHQIRYMRILQAGLARLQQLVSQLTGASPDEVRPAAATELAAPAPPQGSRKPTAADCLTQAQTIYCRELSREISLAVRYYEETIHAGAPDHGVIVAAAGFTASAADSLSNLTSINFGAADAPPEAPQSPSPGSAASNPGSNWHVPIGLCCYDQDGLDSARAGATTDREAA